MHFTFGPRLKLAFILCGTIWIAAVWKSQDLRNPDFNFVGKVTRDVATEGVKASKEAIKFIPATAQADAAARPQPQPIAPNLPASPVDQETAPPPPLRPNAAIAKALGCTTVIAPSIQPLDNRLYMNWKTRAGEFPRATLADLQVSSGANAACIIDSKPDANYAIWPITLDGAPGRLVAVFDKRWNLTDHKVHPLIP